MPNANQPDHIDLKKVEPILPSVNRPGGATGGYLPREWEITPQGDFVEVLER